MSSVEKLLAVDRASSNGLHKKYCRLVADAVRDSYVKNECPIVKAVLARNWGDVAKFFRDVEIGRDVSSSIGNPSDEFVKYARNQMVAVDLGKSAPVTPRRNVTQTSFALEPMFTRQVQPLLVQVGQVVIPILVVVIMGYVLVRAVSTDEIIPKEKADKKDPVAELMDALASRVALLETAGRDAASNNGLFQAALTRKIDEKLAENNGISAAHLDNMKRQADQNIKRETDRLADLGRQYGDNVLAVNSLAAAAQTTATACALTTKTLDETKAKIDPVNAQVDLLTTRVTKLDVVVKTVAKDQADSFRVYMAFFAVALLICGLTSLYMYASVVRVSQLSEDVMKLAPSHTALAQRVKLLGDRVDVLEQDVVEPPPAAEAPAGPGGARRARRGGH